MKKRKKATWQKTLWLFIIIIIREKDVLTIILEKNIIIFVTAAQVYSLEQIVNKKPSANDHHQQLHPFLGTNNTTNNVHNRFQTRAPQHSWEERALYPNKSQTRHTWGDTLVEEEYSRQEIADPALVECSLSLPLPLRFTLVPPPINSYI